MSTLLHLKNPVPEKVVQVSDSEGFTVRGLSPVGVYGLYLRHAGEMGGLFERLINSVRNEGAPETADVETLVLNTISNFPLLMAEVVTLGSGGDPADTDEFGKALVIAMSLNLAVQADAVKKIGELTFTSEMTPGKLAALVGQMIMATTGAVTANSPAIFANGSGESAAT